MYIIHNVKFHTAAYIQSIAHILSEHKLVRISSIPQQQLHQSFILLQTRYVQTTARVAVREIHLCTCHACHSQQYVSSCFVDKKVYLYSNPFLFNLTVAKNRVRLTSFLIHRQKSKLKID